MKILVCNVGSTSLKFKLYAMPECRLLAQCKVERVGSVDDAVFQFKNFRTIHEISREKVDIPDYRTGINTFLEYLTDTENGVISSIGEIDRVCYKATLSKNHFGVHELTDEVMDGTGKAP
jgi:acetate kinase